MSFLTGLKALIGSPTIVSTVADTVKSGMTMWDNSNFTDQEKAANVLKMTDAWLEIQKATAGENSLKSITRRWLACGILFNFLLLVNIGVSLILIGKTDKVTSLKDFIIDTNMGWMALSVVIFYFGYYAVANMRKDK